MNSHAMFGPEYVKIETMWKRDRQGIVMPGEWTLPEFEYLAALPWVWSEKVDGMSLRLHWNGEYVTIGGRNDEAQLPATLVAELANRKYGPDYRPRTLLDPERWSEVALGPDLDFTVYGEAYGGEIRKGTQYRPDMAVIVFDVLVGSDTGRWWLRPRDVADVAFKLGLQTVPEVSVPGDSTPIAAWEAIKAGTLTSHWEGAQIEGLVGRPGADLFTRAGDRVLTKLKGRDWAGLARKLGYPDEAVAEK